MGYKKSWVKWVSGLAGLGLISYVIWPGIHWIKHSPDAFNPDASRTGEKSAAGSGTSNGIAPSTQPKTIELNDVEVDQGLKSAFVFGYLLMGLQNGKVIYRSQLNNIKVSADWDHAILSFSTEGNRGYVYIPRLAIVNLKTHTNLEPTDAEQYFPLQFPEPYRWDITTNPSLPCAFIKVLDRENETVLVGFKFRTNP